MPKAQKQARSSKNRATPLAPRNTNASKQAPGSKKAGETKKAVENEPSRAASPQASKPTASTNDEVSAVDAESANNYLILAYLTHSTDPQISRLLSLPPSLTFDKLHQVLQIAFGWASSHMHGFNVSLIDDNDDDDDDARPMNSRICLSLSPHPMDLPDLNQEAETEFTLADVYEKPEWRNKAEIEYEYDFGDGWIHQLALLGRATPGTNAQFGAPGNVKVMCLHGQGHGVAEDVGGIPGWEDLKDAFKHPRKADSRERIDWYKNYCHNGDKKLDPYAFDVFGVNDGLRDAFFEG